MKISVITPSLNSSKYIKNTIDSVLFREYANFEHIVVDADSTYDTLKILKSYKV
jgi:glycosyltransferase involved in cell wall biosynthesis